MLWLCLTCMYCETVMLLFVQKICLEQLQCFIFQISTQHTYISRSSYNTEIHSMAVLVSCIVNNDIVKILFLNFFSQMISW
jgi:hypothetical protein